MILQLLILFSSCAAIALLAQLDGRLRFWGHIAGLLGQPAWLLVTWEAQTWAIFVVALWWTAFYAWGAARHWFRFYG
jgi:hypothetical protein